MNINSRTSKINFTGFKSGAIASFTGLRAAPIKVAAQIVPIQSGSGDPAPDNIRPIIGASECNVVRCGINLWNEEWEEGRLSSGVPVPSSNQIRSKNFCPLKPNTTYYLYSSKTDGGANNKYYVLIVFYDKLQSYISEMWTNRLTFISPSNAYYFKICTNSSTVVYGNTYNNDISINYPSTDTEYHAYNGNTYTIQLGDTYYGGVLDVTSGVLTVTHANIASYNGEPINEPWICSEAVYSEGTTPPIGSQVVYPLATPITVQLTPTQVEQLLGQNNVWADTGNVKVFYVTV